MLAIEVMTRPSAAVAYLLLGISVFVNPHLVREGGWLTLGYRQPDCVQQAIGNAEIVTSRSLDVDQDGNPDQVVIYGDSDLYILVVTYPSPQACKLVLNEYLTSRVLTTGQQTVYVRETELVELTGDDRPELYIWFEKRDGGPREEVAFHAVYTFLNGNWQEALRITQCLAFSSFEFQDASSGAKGIYIDEDRHCEPPWSSQRTFNVLEWNGSKFVSIKNGTVDRWSVYPSWWIIICLSPILVGLALVLLMMALKVRR